MAIRCMFVRTMRGGVRLRQAGRTSAAYATTIHKAQKFEYPAVVIPLATQHYAMLARNPLYTGVTRGKRLVVIR